MPACSQGPGIDKRQKDVCGKMKSDSKKSKSVFE